MTNVTNEEYPEQDDPSVKIIGIESVSSFKSCISCKCRVIKMEGEDEIARCTKCNTVQFMAQTKYLLAANFTVKTTSEEKCMFEHMRIFYLTYVKLKTAQT